MPLAFSQFSIFYDHRSSQRLLPLTVPSPSEPQRADFPTSLPSFCCLLLLSSHLLPPAHGPFAAPLCLHGAPSPAVPRAGTGFGISGIIPAFPRGCAEGEEKSPSSAEAPGVPAPTGHRGHLCPAPGDTARAVPGLLQGLGTRVPAQSREDTRMPGIQCSGQTDGQVDAQLQRPKTSLSCSSRSSTRQGRDCPVTAHFGHHVEKWEALVYLFPIPTSTPSLPSFGGSAAQQGLHCQAAPRTLRVLCQPLPCSSPLKTGRHVLHFSGMRSPTGANYNS